MYNNFFPAFTYFIFLLYFGTVENIGGNSQSGCQVLLTDPLMESQYLSIGQVHNALVNVHNCVLRYIRGTSM